MTQRSLALKLRVLRAERALTIEQAATRAGVTPETISDAERGRRNPYLPTLRKLAAAYDVPVEELLASEVEEPEAALAGSSPKGGAPPETGTEALDELLDRVGARTRNLADPDLIRSLQGAGEAAVLRTLRETRGELELLIPELRDFREWVKPGDESYMVVNRVLEKVSLQVLALNLFLRARGEVEPEEEAVDIDKLTRDLEEVDRVFAMVS